MGVGVDFVEKAKGGLGLAKGKGCRKTWPGRVRVAGGPASLGALTSGVPLNKPEDRSQILGTLDAGSGA